MPAAHRVSPERGAVLPLVVFAMVALLGFAALAIDVGDALLHKRRLQAAVDFAVLAGAQKLPIDAEAVADARVVFKRNLSAADDAASTATVWTSCRVTGCPRLDKVSAKASVKVKTSFARVFGIDSLTVGVDAAACGPCDSSPRKFDVMLVIDRSDQSCILDGSGVRDDQGVGCEDLIHAKEGIQSLLGFFDPLYDRIGLAAVSSGDSRAPFDHRGQYPCDAATDQGPIDNVKNHRFFKTRGDFMDGTPADHDSWVLAPLAGGFKLANETLNPASPLLTTLDCLQNKYWGPIAPAIEEATQELVLRGRPEPEVEKVIVYIGDGDDAVQPMQRDNAGRSQPVRSWYDPTLGNDMAPCHDAVGQARAAKDAGIDVYTIAYDLKVVPAKPCFTGNLTGVPAYVEPGIDTRSTLERMANDTEHAYERRTPEQLFGVFNEVGREIVLGGTRLVE